MTTRTEKKIKTLTPKSKKDSTASTPILVQSEGNEKDLELKKHQSDLVSDALIVKKLIEKNKDLVAFQTKSQDRIDTLTRHIKHLNETIVAMQKYNVASSYIILKPAPLKKIELDFIKKLSFLYKANLRFGPSLAFSHYKSCLYLVNNDLFDPSYYAEQANISHLSAFDLLVDYIFNGFQQGLSPSIGFSTHKYLNYYPDVKAAGIEPVTHYYKFGQLENRVHPRGLALQTPLNLDTINRHYGLSLSLGLTAPVITLPSHKSSFECEPHNWPVQKRPDIKGSLLSLYDVRPEDAVPLEGAMGDKFMAKFDLLGDEPNFSGAVAYLNALKSKATISRLDPDVSIIIPVYGQLNYTLNCIHSLLLHESRFSFEIIIGDDQSKDQTSQWLTKLPFITHIIHTENGGFIENCNRSSQNANGKYIIMLNNDVRVVANWLDELIGAFELFPKAGLIGSKLFYPDGSLQEAGGIIWQDGSAWNFGRNDDPNRPRYCYAREVDYISGCSIALPTALWRELKGFDTYYKPAYAEDSDLCFRVRQSGYETWLQPLSRVIHYEGKTSGTNTAQGIKAYQVNNAVKLFERWKNKLEAHRPNAEAPWLEYERKVQKRVLIIDATNPAPWQDAGSVTAVTTIRLYQMLGYKVTFSPQDNFLFEPKQVRCLQRTGVECIYAPFDRSQVEFLKQQGHMFDIIQVFRIGVMDKIVDDIRHYAPQAHIAFHVSDLHFLRMEREANLSKNAKYLEESKATKKRELALIERADCTIVHSPIEADILMEALPSAPVVVFPVVMDYVGTEVGFDPRKDIMFLGGYAHGPNVDAVKYFIKSIWPLLILKLPKDAQFLIVGSKPPQEIKDLANDRIIVTGMVEDLQPWFDRSRVFAASIRFGAGVKGKITTAMSYGLPVVATQCAAEGMYLVEGESVIIADEPIEFANAILDLYFNKAKWESMQEASKVFIEEKNSYEMGMKVVTDLIAKAKQHHSLNKN
jgi:O-antigen biosynthesis protein